MTLKEKAEAKAKEYQVNDVCKIWNDGCPNVFGASMQMFEWTKQKVVTRACEYWATVALNCGSGETCYFIVNCIEDFKKHIEE